GQLILGADDGFPVNFGKPVSGLTTSGAGGLNFSFSKKKHNRVFISYLGNGYDKKLEETTKTRNFTPQGNYEQHQESNETPQNYSHNMNFGLRQRIDSTQNFILNGKLAFTHGKVPGNSVSLSHNNDTLVNSLFSKTNDKSNGVSGSVNGSYQNKLNSNKTVLKLTADLALTKGLTNTRFENKAMYYYPPGEVITNQFQDKNSESLKYSLSTSLLQHLWRSVTIEPKIRFGQTFESMNRQQGTPAPSETIIDSLSPDFDQRHDWLRPEVGIRRNTDKTRFMAGLGFETGRTHNSLWDDDSVSTSYHALLPRLSWEYDYRTGKRLSLYYYTSVNTPPIQMLQPVVNNSNPLFLTYGNRYLEPEYLHNLQLTWLLFDQFSFTSLFTSLNATYAVNKINWDRTINDQLVQWMKPVNVSDDLSLEGGIDFSTPIRKFGIEVSANIRETYNRGINIINGTSNVNTNLSHRFSLSFDNRKKNKWDVITGAAMQMTNSQYSVQESLDNKYFDLSWFAEVSFNPNDSWNFMVSADVTNYTAQSFDKPVSIPLVNAEINHYFLKNNRGVISLNIFDMLDQNTGLQRTGDMNYLMEKQSNIIGRYAMVSFKYRLNKFGDNGGGVDVEINRR
nr:outer membrane beta-barrel protein [Bacteroidota bacterium]